MRSLLPVLAFLAAAAPLPAVAQAPPQCALSVQFGSYAMGIDRPAFDRVQALLKRDARVRGVALQRWGREGETTLCVTLRRERNAKAVFERVKAALPAKPRGPIVVETLGMRFEAPRAR